MDDVEIRTAELAELLGIQPRAVRDLTERGIVQKARRGRYPLKASVGAYCEHLRGVASGRGGEAEVYELTAERARLAKEQADDRAYRNAVARRELVRVEDVAREWADALRKVRAAILAVPSRLRQRLPHLTAHDVEALDGELRRALEEASRDD
ncbi:hypothetical protein [Roseovarius salinarum]|uniref:hypothetical protein n=1 Tax=Roseovarius salinarum TaxID=1981892 RepID=UPI000C34014F|nr:hypothetical protein [Roseovarius salinarum]